MSNRPMAYSVFDGLWAISPTELRLIVARLLGNMDAAATQAGLVDRRNLPKPTGGSVGVIPVYGLLTPKRDWLSELFGGTAYEDLSASLRAAMGNKAIKTIVLDINSPGGSVAGATEFAREVMHARSRKPVIAQIQYTGASAAYWIASAAREIVAAPSSQVGSIGVYGVHDDVSEALAKIGIKRTYISAGTGKVDGNDTEPLSEEARGRMTDSVEKAYDRMVGDVVRGRGQGMTAERVTKDWKAHVYGASEAKSIGMVDRIETLDETLARILTASPDASDQRAALDFTSSEGTDQEQPSLAATSQDRQAMLDLERQVFEMQL